MHKLETCRQYWFGYFGYYIRPLPPKYPPISDDAFIYIHRCYLFGLQLLNMSIQKCDRLLLKCKILTPIHQVPLNYIKTIKMIFLQYQKMENKMHN